MRPADVRPADVGSSDLTPPNAQRDDPASSRAVIAQTDRLALHRLALDDAAFILGLLNDPSWLRYIGDKNVTTLAAAGRWISEGPQRMYAEHGFGLYLVRLRSAQAQFSGQAHGPVGALPAAAGSPIGICGLIRRDTLDDVDLGFAYLPRFWKQGYATEAGQAMLAQARALKMQRIAAIANPENAASRRVLERLGFTLDRIARLNGERVESCVYLRQLSGAVQR